MPELVWTGGENNWPRRRPLQKDRWPTPHSSASERWWDTSAVTPLTPTMHCGRLTPTKSKGISIKFTPGRATRTWAPTFETLNLRNPHFECWWNEMLNTLNSPARKARRHDTCQRRTNDCVLILAAVSYTTDLFFLLELSCYKKKQWQKTVVVPQVPGIMPRCKSPWHPETSSDKWSQHPDITQIAPPSCCRRLVRACGHQECVPDSRGGR